MGGPFWGHTPWELAKMDVSVITVLQSKSLFGAPVCQPLLHQTLGQFMTAANESEISAARILLSFHLCSPHR